MSTFTSNLHCRHDLVTKSPDSLNSFHSLKFHGNFLPRELFNIRQTYHRYFINLFALEIKFEVLPINWYYFFSLQIVSHAQNYYLNHKGTHIWHMSSLFFFSKCEEKLVIFTNFFPKQSLFPKCYQVVFAIR